MSARRTTLTLLGCTGLLLGLTALPAQAAPTACASGSALVGVEDLNPDFEGPLWAPIPLERLQKADRNDDGMLCVRVVEPPSTPPGLGIPEGETNALVLFVDNPRGLG